MFKIVVQVQVEQVLDQEAQVGQARAPQVQDQGLQALDPVGRELEVKVFHPSQKAEVAQVAPVTDQVQLQRTNKVCKVASSLNRLMRDINQVMFLRSPNLK